MYCNRTIEENQQHKYCTVHTHIHTPTAALLKHILKLAVTQAPRTRWVGVAVSLLTPQSHYWHRSVIVDTGVFVDTAESLLAPRSHCNTPESLLTPQRRSRKNLNFSSIKGIFWPTMYYWIDLCSKSRIISGKDSVVNIRGDVPPPSVRVYTACSPSS